MPGPPPPSRLAVVLPPSDGQRLRRWRAAAWRRAVAAMRPRHALARVPRQLLAAPLARQALAGPHPRALGRGDSSARRVALLLADQHQRARGLRRVAGLCPARRLVARSLARRLRLRAQREDVLQQPAELAAGDDGEDALAPEAAPVLSPLVPSGALGTAPLPCRASSARRAVRSCTGSSRFVRSCSSMRAGTTSSNTGLASNSLCPPAVVRGGYAMLSMLCCAML